MTEHDQVFLTRQQVLARFSISNTTLYRWINESEMNFPKPYHMGLRCVRWKISELEAWEQARQREDIAA